MFKYQNPEINDDELLQAYEFVNSLNEDELIEELAFNMYIIRHILSKLNTNDINVTASDGDAMHFCCDSIVTGTKH